MRTAAIDLTEYRPKHTVEKLGGGRFRIHVTPMAIFRDVVGAKGETVILTEGQFRRYRAWMTNRQLIHDALPDLSDAQREILLTGLAPDVFDKLVPEPEASKPIEGRR
jgi:hypothetical protein